jgi:hypothetical protein
MITRSLETFDYYTDRLAEKTIIPAVKWGYETTHVVASSVAGCFSKRLGKGVSHLFKDPLPSCVIVFFTDKIEKLTAPLSKRKPFENRCMNYFDRSFTSGMQLLNAYIKELNYLLRLPEDIRKFFSVFSFEKFFTKLAKACGEDWDWINGIYLQLKRDFLALVGKVLYLADQTIRCFTFGYQLEVFGYLGAVIHNARVGVRTRFADIANATIDHREKLIRRDVIAAVADTLLDVTAKTALNLGIKATLGLGLLFLARHQAAGSQTALKAIDLTAAAGVLGILCCAFKPIIDDYYDVYNPNYDPYRSHIAAFCQKNNLEMIAPILEGIKAFIRADEEHQVMKQKSPEPIVEEVETPGNDDLGIIIA